MIPAVEPKMRHIRWGDDGGFAEFGGTLGLGMREKEGPSNTLAH